MTTLVDRFMRFVALAPEAIAVTDGAQTLSYAQLEVKSNQLARRLIAMGNCPERIVGVSFQRSADLIIALLAVLKSGAAYLPLDPAYPMARLKFLVSDAKPSVIISAPNIEMPDIGIPNIHFTLENEEKYEETAVGNTDRLSPLYPNHPAYVIYTSGSTGLPKGVIVPHQCFLSLLDATAPVFDLNSSDVWTAFHSYAFDFSVWEIWGALLTGGRVVIVPAEATWSANDFLDLLEKEQVTLLSQTPSSFASLDRVDGKGSKKLESLRLVVFGGEALDPTRLDGWFVRRPYSPRMVNMYGITETTVHVTMRDIQPEMRQASSESPIGLPLSGFRDYVFDDEIKSVSSGEVGELYLGGKQLARGYLARPALTATRFIADPNGNGERLYRTGDLVRRLDDGLGFIGRADAQLSLRGFRIEPNEVEAALGSYEGVTGSAVAVKPDPDGVEGDECLTAYVVIVNGEVDERGLRAHLSRILPSHLIPSHIVSLPALPLTPNRKLDRGALPVPLSRRNPKTDFRKELLQRRLSNRLEQS